MSSRGESEGVSTQGQSLAPPVSPPRAAVLGDALSLLQPLEAGIRERLPRREFLARVDATRHPIHEILCDHYGDPDFARLLYLKATNFVVSRYHYASRHAQLASRAVTLMLDPSNSCQLACAGCVHTENPEFRAQLQWPHGVMRPRTFAALLRDVGPFALNTVLYNYGEPLLNKWIAEFIELAHSYGMTTHLSTNLSMRFDVERFIEAGPDRVILSIDGVTQPTYARFRKGGDLDLVLENVRRMVELRRRRGVSRPFLTWRFFTFEHNVHEVDEVMRLAREIEVDQLIIGTPFDVSMDDPGVRVAVSEKRGRHDFVDLSTRVDNPPLRDLVRPHPELEALVEQGWSRRADAFPEEPRLDPGSTCVWLYYNMTVDAVGRVMPCCISPTLTKNLVFGNLADGSADLYNIDAFQEARLGFADRPRLEARRAGATHAAPWCVSCPKQPLLTHAPINAARDLCALDFKRALFGADLGFWWRFAEW